MPSSQPRLLLTALAATLISGARVAHAQRPDEASYRWSGTDSVRVKRFLTTLQTAVANDDSVAVSKLFQYPTLPVWDGHERLVLRNSGELLPVYRAVFSPEVRRLILGATLDSLHADWRGVTLGKGRLWFQTATDHDPRIASIRK